METSLGEDLVLLALRPNGTMHAHQKLRFALSGSELFRLAEMGRVELSTWITVREVRETGDALLDAALADICARGVGSPPRSWIARARPGLRERYLERLAGKGVVRLEKHRALGLFRVNRWRILDIGHAQEVRARLDAIATSTGELTPDQIAFAGLVHVAGLDEALYPAGPGAEARARLRQIARKRPVRQVTATSSAVTASQDSMSWLLSAVIMASIDASAPGAAFTGPEGATHHTPHHQAPGHDHHTHHGGFDASHHQTHHGGFDAGGGFSGGHHN